MPNTMRPAKQLTNGFADSDFVYTAGSGFKFTQS